jgi:hypothetical protein
VCELRLGAEFRLTDSVRVTRPDSPPRAAHLPTRHPCWAARLNQGEPHLRPACPGCPPFLLLLPLAAAAPPFLLLALATLHPTVTAACYISMRLAHLVRMVYTLM